MAARTSDTARRVRGLRPPFRTRRLELRWPSARLNDQVVRLLNDPVVTRWTLRVPSPYTARDAAEFVRRARANRRSARSLSFQIVRRADGALLGGAGIHGLGSASRTGEIGYLIGRGYRGQGYATEAVGALVRVAFGPLALHRIEARVFPGNSRSERVLLKQGFRREGRLRESVRKDGRLVDEIVYGRLRSDRLPAGRGRSASAGRGSDPRTR
jgi:[ribosomal protein S5]-alanine N-acetyltransferase